MQQQNKRCCFSHKFQRAGRPNEIHDSFSSLVKTFFKQRIRWITGHTILKLFWVWSPVHTLHWACIHVSQYASCPAPACSVPRIQQGASSWELHNNLQFAFASECVSFPCNFTAPRWNRLGLHDCKKMKALNLLKIQSCGSPARSDTYFQLSVQPLLCEWKHC